MLNQKAKKQRTRRSNGQSRPTSSATSSATKKSTTRKSRKPAAKPPAPKKPVAPPREQISRVNFLRATQMLGFLEDLKTQHITVLRNTNFPFDRITIPNVDFFSPELVRLYALDIRQDPDVFLEHCR